MPENMPPLETDVKTMPRLYLLDGSSYIYRAFYGIRDLATAGGLPTNAVYGFTKMLLNLLHQERPDYLAVVFDRPREETFRRQLYPDYKAQREATPTELLVQLPYIRQVVAALKIPALEAPGFEADDVIATLTTKATCPVDIVTGDRDLFQLVDDSRPVRVLYTARGMSRLESVTEDVITAKYGIPGRAYADFALLRGDPSDGLPGVPGIGDKSAASLINTYGDLAGIIRQLRVDTDTPPPDADNVSRLATTATPPLPAGARRKLIDALEYLTVALPVVRVATDIDLPEPSDRLPPAADADALFNLGRRLGLGGSLSRVIAALELDLPAN